jgi:hypothetical protein
MITWRKVYGSENWLKGDRAEPFRHFQLILRANGWLYGDTPKGQPWELLATGGGRPESLTFHATRDEALKSAEQWI